MKEVPLHGEKAAGRVALVDDEDYELVMQLRWNVSESFARDGRRIAGPYAIATAPVSGERRPKLMHVLIMGRPYIDHADHNGLNNQRYNLRPADYSQNGGNRRPQLGSASSYKGVHWRRSRNRWQADICVRGTRIYLGRYRTEIEAALAYNAAASAAFGEFAYLNEVEPAA